MGRNLGSFAASEEPAVVASADPVTQLRQQVQFLLRRAKAQDQGERVGAGALVEYYSDLSSGILDPVNMRIEDIQFRVIINPAGQITFSTQPVQVISRYNFSFRRMMASVMNPGFVGAGPALLNFNVQEAGRDFNIFKTPVNMGTLLATGGAGNIAEWDGIYTTVPGTQLVVNWFVDTRWAALVGATQEYTVHLLGDLTVCRPGR